MSARLKTAGGAWEIRDGGAEMPNGPALASAAGPAAPSPSRVPMSAGRLSPDRTIDRIAVPAPIAAAPLAGKRSAPPADIAAAAQSAWTEARSQIAAPRPPGGVPTEQLEPAARMAAQALLGLSLRDVAPSAGLPEHVERPTQIGRIPSPFLREGQGSGQVSALTWSAAPSGSAVLVKPELAFKDVRLGMDLAVARDMDPARGVLKGNPSLRAGVALGEAGHMGATTLDVGYRPAGRNRAELTRLSGETVLIARNGRTLKLNGSVSSSPVADTAYKVGLTVAARIF